MTTVVYPQQIQAQLLQKKISTTSFSVWIQLAVLEHDQEEAGVHMGLDELSQELGWSISTLQRAFRQLESADCLRVTRRKKAGNIYYPVVPVLK